MRTGLARWLRWTHNLIKINIRVVAVAAAAKNARERNDHSGKSNCTTAIGQCSVADPLRQQAPLALFLLFGVGIHGRLKPEHCWQQQIISKK